MKNHWATVDFYVRIVLVSLWFFIAAFLSSLILPFRWRDPSMGAVFGRLLSFGGLRIMGIKVQVNHQVRLYLHQPCIYVTNHQSNFDIVSMSAMYPHRTAIIGKKELLKIPFFGAFFYGSGNILIDRKDRVNSLSGLQAARDYIVKNKVSVWLFPEGTRNRGSNELLPFKKGAFHLAITAQVPIVPIVHQHLFRYLEVKKKRIYHDSVIPIEVLEPIPTTGMTVADVSKLMATVRSKMQAVLDTESMRASAQGRDEADRADRG